MGNKAWAWVVAAFVGLSIGLYTAFVAMCFWNWFAVRVLNVRSISFLEMVGIVWLIQLFTEKDDNNEARWRVLFTTIEACVPDNNRKMLAEAMQEQKENIWIDAAAMAWKRIIGNTIMLILGFGLDAFIE
jgi:hypothetical protein